MSKMSGHTSVPQVKQHLRGVDCANNMDGRLLTDKLCPTCLKIKMIAEAEERKRVLAERTKLEMERGAYITVMKEFEREFNPDYSEPRPNSRITPEDRARRDAYKKYLHDWSKE